MLGLCITLALLVAFVSQRAAQQGARLCKKLLKKRLWLQENQRYLR
jgi:hypothetical protein